jgi:hypothetical protein
LGGGGNLRRWRCCVLCRLGDNPVWDLFYLALNRLISHPVNNDDNPLTEGKILPGFRLVEEKVVKTIGREG